MTKTGLIGKKVIGWYSFLGEEDLHCRYGEVCLLETQTEYKQEEYEGEIPPNAKIIGAFLPQEYYVGYLLETKSMVRTTLPFIDFYSEMMSEEEKNKVFDDFHKTQKKIEREIRKESKKKSIHAPLTPIDEYKKRLKTIIDLGYTEEEARKMIKEQDEIGPRHRKLRNDE